MSCSRLSCKDAFGQKHFSNYPFARHKCIYERSERIVSGDETGLERRDWSREKGSLIVSQED